MIPISIITILVLTFIAVVSYTFKTDTREFKILSDALNKQGIELKSFEYLSYAEVLEITGLETLPNVKMSSSKKMRSDSQFFEMKVIDHDKKEKKLFGRSDKEAFKIYNIEFQTDLKKLC